MSIGVNYVSTSGYKVIEFNASDIPGVKSHIVTVPEKHKVVGTCSFDEIFKKYGARVPGDAPSGTDSMLVVEW